MFRNTTDNQIAEISSKQIIASMKGHDRVENGMEITEYDLSTGGGHDAMAMRLLARMHDMATTISDPDEDSIRKICGGIYVFIPGVPTVKIFRSMVFFTRISPVGIRCRVPFSEFSKMASLYEKNKKELIAREFFKNI